MDLELLKREFEEAKKRQTTGEYWFPKESVNVIRVLPPKNPKKLFYALTGLHYGLLGSGMELCPKITFGKPCPICELLAKLTELNIPKAAKLIGDLGVRKRFAMNILDLDGDPNKIVQFLAPGKVRVKIMSAIFDVDYGDITHATKGRNIVVEKTTNPMNRINTDYDVRPKPNFAPVDPKIIEAILDLDEILASRLKSYEQLQKILLGEEDGIESIDDVIALYEEKGHKKGEQNLQKQPGAKPLKIDGSLSEPIKDTEPIKETEQKSIDPIQEKISKLFKK